VVELTIGLKISHGREAEVYAWDGDAVLKLYRPGFGGYVAEASVLAALDGRGVAPALAGTVEIDGRHGLILERVDGSDMLALLQRAPWRMLGLAVPTQEVGNTRLIGGRPPSAVCGR
jgi:hypothetical protein